MTFSSKMDYEVGNIQDLKYLFFPSLDVMSAHSLPCEPAVRTHWPRHHKILLTAHHHNLIQQTSGRYFTFYFCLNQAATEENDDDDD